VNQLMPLSFQSIFLQSLQLFSRMACSLFILITGYYMSNKDIWSGHYKKIVPLVTQCYFYSFLCLLIIVLFNHNIISFSIIKSSFFPLFWGNWFIEYYIILYLFIPFINRLLKSISEANYIKLIALLLLVWSVIPTFTKKAWEFSNLDFMIVMYLFGGFFHKFKLDHKYNTKRLVMITVLSSMLLFLSVFICNIIGNIYSIPFFIEHSGYLKEFSSIICVPLAICLFLLFKSLNFYNPCINIIGSTTLGVYLFSDNSIMANIIWTVIYPNTNYVYFPYVHFVVKIVSVFVIGLFIDIIRQLLFVPIAHKLGLYERIYSIFVKIYKIIQTFFMRFISYVSAY